MCHGGDGSTLVIVQPELVAHVAAQFEAYERTAGNWFRRERPSDMVFASGQEWIEFAGERGEYPYFETVLQLWWMW